MKYEKIKSISTYDELMQDDTFRNKHEKSYRELVLSELLLAIMAEDKISIRSLAKQAGISPAIIQDIRSGKRDNLTLKTFPNKKFVDVGSIINQTISEARKSLF